MKNSKKLPELLAPAGNFECLLAAVEAEGIQAEPVFHGLGERKRVQKLYVERIEEAMQEAAG